VLCCNQAFNNEHNPDESTKHALNDLDIGSKSVVKKQRGQGRTNGSSPNVLRYLDFRIKRSPDWRFNLNVADSAVQFLMMKTIFDVTIKQTDRWIPSHLRNLALLR
jgi:hypothetical protein